MASRLSYVAQYASLPTVGGIGIMTSGKSNWKFREYTIPKQRDQVLKRSRVFFWMP